MKYLCWFSRATGAIAGYRSRGSDELLPDPNSEYDFAWSDAQPSAGAWLEGEKIVARPRPPTTDHSWSEVERRWLPLPIAEIRDRAFTQIDEVAGRVRLRYITSVPGQAETYTRKEAQARAWVAVGFSGPAPSFIAAEAVALGVPPQQVAEEVISLADFWEQAKGPQIEATRIAGKATVRAAATESEIRAATDSAIQALEAL